MMRSQEQRVLQLQEPTLFNLERQGMFMRCPIFTNQNFSSSFPASSNIPISPKSILAANNRVSVDSDEPNRTKRLKATEVEKTHDEVKATDDDAVVVSPLKFTIKLNPKSDPKPRSKSNPKRKPKPKPKPAKEGEPKPLSLSFFDSSTSPEEIKATLDSKLDKMKSDLVFALKKIDESLACEVAAKIELEDVNCNGGDESIGDPFIMKKILQKSDIGQLSRLMLKKEWLEKHILPFWGPEQEALINSDSGLRVNIYDQDEQTCHALTLRRWGSNHCYVFNNNWNESFVNTRKLQKGDEIGLYWDSFYSHFCFTVLKQRVGQ